MARGARSTPVERFALGAVFLLPLVFWPPLQRPFSVPKFWLLACLAAWLAGAETVFAARPPRRPGATTAWANHLGWPLLAFVAAVGLSAAFAASVSIEALALALLPLPLFLAVRARQIDPDRLVAAIAWSSTALSLVAVLQWLDLDPLRLLAWNPDVSGASRMRVYGTLGNPNFTAAWLSATLPLVLPRNVASRWWRAIPLALQLCAIAATGSRVVVLAVPLMTLVLMLARWRLRSRRWVIMAVAAAAFALAAAWLSPARPLGATLEGRYDLARATAAHLAGVPAVGFGPGSFERHFAGWQADAPRARGRGTAAPALVAPVDHAHNDYLEFWVEFGAVGVLAFAALVTWLVIRAWPPRSWTAEVAAAGVAGLLAIALVDFPFHRPAEWTLLWMLLAAMGRRAEERTNREGSV